MSAVTSAVTPGPGRLAIADLAAALTLVEAGTVEAAVASAVGALP